MAGREHESSKFLRGMVALSPRRAEVLLSLEDLDRAVEKAVANGTPTYSADTTHAIGHASIERLADMVARDIRTADIIEAFEIAYSSALAHMITLIAVNARLDASALTDIMIEDVASRTAECVRIIMRNTANRP